MKRSIWNKYSFGWLTLALFLFSLAGHFLFSWFAYVDEQQAHGFSIQVSDYAIQTVRDMFENWQSEFLQIIWQVLGLAAFIWVGSPESKEGKQCLEAKVDALITALNPEESKSKLKHFGEEYEKRTGSSVWSRYLFAWLTIAFFTYSIAGHFKFGWFAYVGEQREMGQTVVAGEFWVRSLRDTFENWQSEFLQLLWQIGGLAYFCFLGSPLSREADERLEAKIDAVIRQIEPRGADSTISRIDEEFQRK